MKKHGIIAILFIAGFSVSVAALDPGPIIAELRRKIDENIAYADITGPSSVQSVYEFSAFQGYVEQLRPYYADIVNNEEQYLFYVNLLAAALLGKEADAELCKFNVQ